MKKFLSLTVLAAALLISAPASAQVKFGIKGGVNLTNMTFNEDTYDADNRCGFFVGPTVKLSVPVTGLSFDASALFDQRSAKIKGTNEKLKQNSIQIPINVRYGVGLGSTASVFAFAGPQFGFNIGDKEQLHDTFEWKASNFSVNVGIGASIINHLQVTANYNIACGKTGESVYNKVASVRSHNNAWQIGVAYFF